MPDGIGQLLSLKELYLQSLELTSFPNEIFKLTGVVILGLSNNRLSQIPEEIEVFSKLKYLFLYNTGIKKIPKSIGSLKELRRINLSHNMIQYLPLTIWNLPKCTRLEIKRNPLILKRNEDSFIMDENSLYNHFQDHLIYPIFKTCNFKRISVKIFESQFVNDTHWRIENLKNIQRKIIPQHNLTIYQLHEIWKTKLKKYTEAELIYNERIESYFRSLHNYECYYRNIITNESSYSYGLSLLEGIFEFLLLSSNETIQTHLKIISEAIASKSLYYVLPTLMASYFLLSDEFKLNKINRFKIIENIIAVYKELIFEQEFLLGNKKEHLDSMKHWKMKLSEKL